MIRDWLERVEGWLLPPRCVLCLDPGRRPALDLCPACEHELERNEPACVRCAGPLATPGTGPAGDVCESCRALPPAFDRALAPLRYAWPAVELVRGFKYRGQLAHGRVLGTLLAEHAGSVPDAQAQPQLLVPVPLHARRERERGYNQAWELARVAGRRLGIRVAAQACVRVRDTVPQAQLAAGARRANVRAAFAVPKPLAVRHVALVDDVMTTGATLGALAQALRAAGVERIDAWAAARAVPDQSGRNT